MEQAGFRILIVEKSSDVNDALTLLQSLSNKQELSRSSYRKLATEASIAKTSKTAAAGQKRGSSYKVLDKKDKRTLELSNKKTLANDTPSFLVVGK